ncbi:unnamed protein product [Staurois parvus]|uniref:Uncharacterized protein n=1 Tax=Staurois parvus TaxID=386267 RepID=A0ABN9EBH6_9NEOB|nr:unnamed protein product [Staurois parvus]
MIGCSAKMITNALKCNQNLKDVEKNYHSITTAWKTANGKDSANNQLQEDQRRSKVTCEYCYKLEDAYVKPSLYVQEAPPAKSHC